MKSNSESTRNASSVFMTHTSQEQLKSFETKEFMKNFKEQEGEEEPVQTIVLHPGSRHIRIGFGSDAVPITIPSVIARKCNNQQGFSFQVVDNVESREFRQEMDRDFKTFMKAVGLRIPMNAYSLVQHYNQAYHSVDVSPMNDPFHMEWSLGQEECYFGQEALEIKDYSLFWPWEWRTWNQTLYKSKMEWRSDVVKLLEYCFAKLKVHELKKRKLIKKQNFLYPVRVCLCVPDMFDSKYVEEMLDILFVDLNIHQVMVVQESLSACCGAGLSSACVVDIGATLTTVGVIDNGELTNSAMALYGGDDVTLEFLFRLQQNKFPINLDLKNTWDWFLCQSLKESWCTANEQELAVQVYEFYKRAPDQTTQKIAIKTYNELYMAPLSLFYPGVFGIEEKLLNFKSNLCHLQPILLKQTEVQMFKTIDEIMGSILLWKLDDAPDVAGMISQPLDVLVSQSLVGPKGRSDEKLKKLASTILLIGGGSCVRGFGTRMLEARIQTHAAEIINSTLESIGLQTLVHNINVNVVAPPREMDPKNVVWKGAAVITRIECSNAAWIQIGDFKAHGSRVLQQKGFIST